jgi:hypothetical protein
MPLGAEPRLLPRGRPTLQIANGEIPPPHDGYAVHDGMITEITGSQSIKPASESANELPPPPTPMTAMTAMTELTPGCTPANSPDSKCLRTFNL